MNRNRFLDLYATYLWPVMRRVVKKPRRCKKCILSEKYAPLKDGLCPECSAAQTVAAPDLEVSDETRAKFDETIKKYVNRNGGRYNAVLLLSGGKDSAYLLDRMRSDYPQLRILCVTVNNGFMSPLAIDSARFVAEKLKTDWLVSNADIEEFAAVLRRSFLELNGRGCYGVVDFADGDLIFKIGAKVASDMGIPLVLGGLSWVQVQRIVGEDDFELVQPSAPHFVFPLAVWRTNEQTIRQIVRSSNLLPQGSDSPMVSNSSLIVSMAVVDILNLGYSSFEPEFAQLVREGKSDRKTWLHLFELLEFATTRGFLDEELSEALRKMNLSRSDVVRSRV
jgi:hypothetical protein